MITNEDTVLDIFIDLPAVRRMDLLDVDGEEIDLLAVGAVDAVEGPSLGPKWGSRVAPKNQRDRTIGESS